MIDIARSKRIGIKQAKKSIANIYKKKVNGKLSIEQQKEVTHHQSIISKWQKSTTKAYKK